MKVLAGVLSLAFAMNCFGDIRVPKSAHESRDFCGLDKRCQLLYEASHFLDDEALKLAEAWIQWGEGAKGDYLSAIQNKQFTAQEISDCSGLNQKQPIQCMSKRGVGKVTIAELLEWGSPEGDLVFVWANLERGNDYIDDEVVIDWFEALVKNHKKKNRPLVAKTLETAIAQMRERKYNSVNRAMNTLYSTAIIWLQNKDAIRRRFIADELLLFPPKYESFLKGIRTHQ